MNLDTHKALKGLNKIRYVTLVLNMEETPCNHQMTSLWTAIMLEEFNFKNVIETFHKLRILDYPYSTAGNNYIHTNIKEYNLKRWYGMETIEFESCWNGRLKFKASRYGVTTPRLITR